MKKLAWISVCNALLYGPHLMAESAGPLTALEKTTRIGPLEWDLHEVSIGTVKRYAKATGFVSRGEKEGGSYIYESGWVQKPGWTWRTPFGVAAQDREPAAHLMYAEAQAICRYFGKRLPTDAEWTQAAYLEQRTTPPAPFVQGQRYRYPNGPSADGSHHLQGRFKGVAPQGSLNRGSGHVPVMTTTAGVNGLYDMGGNLWEWVDGGSGQERITRGASWWYGPERQIESDLATKPMDTRVAYIGFRCVRDVR